MNLQRFVGKNVMVTGGGSGIGRATAHRFAQEGAQVLIVDIRPESADKVAKEIAESGGIAAPIVADVGKTADCERIVKTALEEGGRLDVLISNAGAWTKEPFLEMKEESWDRVMAVNLKASFILGQLAARAMTKSGGGVILYTASIAACGGVRNFAHYNASKAGIVSLVQTMALELAPLGIRVNAVSPGASDTPQSVEVAGEELMQKFRQAFPAAPLNRLGSPQDMAAAFAFLASDEASYITGQNLVVDGGLLVDIYRALD